MGEGRLQEKQFDLLYEEMRRLADEVELIRNQLKALESLPQMNKELHRLSHSIESLAYAALGRDGPRVVSRRRA